MNGALAALGYVGVRRSARRISSDARRPWALLALASGVAVVAALQALALDRTDAHGELDPGVLDALLSFGPLVLPALLFVSTFSSPLRLQVADVSWVLTAPGGARAVVARDLLLRPLTFAAVGVAGTSIARASVGRPLGDVWKVALAAAAAGLALRLVSFGGHLLVVRAGAALALRALAVAWGGAILAAAALDLPGGDALALRPLLEPLVTGVLDPSRLSTPWLLAALAVLLAAAGGVLAAARGFEERAHLAARRLAEMQEALREWRSGHEPARVTESRGGVRSLPGWQALAGERALAFRTLARERHMVVPSILGFGLMLDLGVPVALLVTVPSFGWAWAVVGLLGAWMIGGAQLAIERDHHHLRMAPVRPLPALLWLAAVPAAHRTVSIELSWLLVWLAPGMSAGMWAAGVILIPCLVALAEGAGSVAVAVADRKPIRAALKAGIVVLGLLPAAAVLSVSLGLGASAALAGALAAPTVLAAACSGFTFTAHRAWPRRTRARDQR
jgi:hypothetical protein